MPPCICGKNELYRDCKDPATKVELDRRAAARKAAQAQHGLVLDAAQQVDTGDARLSKEFDNDEMPMKFNDEVTSKFSALHQTKPRLPFVWGFSSKVIPISMPQWTKTNLIAMRVANFSW